MSSRDEVLASVRQALAASPGVDREVPRGYRRQAAPADLVGLFVQRVEDYKATVTRCAGSVVVEHLSAALAGASAVVPDGFPYPVPGAVAANGKSPAALAGVDAVVTTAALGIASTGTIVLDHGPGQGTRVISLLPDLHVCVLTERQIVHGVPEAIASLDPNRPQTWISGPSATSDIELERVEGVHGPRTLHVVLVSG